MYTKREDIFYYITLYNENYPMPPMPEGVEEGILKGIYRLKAAPEPGDNREGDRPRVHLLGCGSLMREALRAQEILAERYGVAADLWSATSYKELRRDALEADRWNLLHPDQEPRKPYIVQVFEGDDRADRRRLGLHEAGAGPDLPAGCRAGSIRWGRTASAAARPARPCAASSRWTPSAW